MRAILLAMAMAALAVAQNPPPTPVVLSTIIIRGAVKCDLTETTARDGVDITCVQMVGGVPAGRGVLIPASGPMNITVTVPTPSPVAGEPPNMDTVVVTAQKTAIGPRGVPAITYSMSINGMMQ